MSTAAAILFTAAALIYAPGVLAIVRKSVTR